MTRSHRRDDRADENAASRLTTKTVSQGERWIMIELPGGKH
jgi:hypothetical protein